MRYRHRQPHPLFIGCAEILAQLQQDQGDSLLERAGHEIRAAQLHEIPSPGIAGGHALEVCGRYPERDFDEGRQTDGSNLAVGDRLAAEVVSDPGNRGRNTRNHARRDHNHQRAIALAIAASDAGGSGEQDVSSFGRVLLVENDGVLFNPARRKRIGKSVQPARGEPGDVPKSAQSSDS